MEERIRAAVAKVRAELESKMSGLRDMAERAKAKMAEAVAKKNELMARLAEFANVGDMLKRIWSSITSLKDRFTSFVSTALQRAVAFIQGGFKAVLAKCIEFVRYLVCTKIKAFLPRSIRRGFENITHQHWPAVKREAMCIALTGKSPENGGEGDLAAIQVDDELGGEAGANPERDDDNAEPPNGGGGGCFGMFGGGGPGITDDDAHEEGLKVFDRISKATSGVAGLIDTLKELPIVDDVVDTFRSTVGHLIPGLDGSSSSSTDSDV